MPSIHFPPGITTLLSKTAKIANWREGNLVRWDDGVTLKPVGGWEQTVFNLTFASRVRAMHRWVALNGIQYTAFLCEQHVYVETSTGFLVDITPVGGMASLSGAVAGYGEGDYGDYTALPDANLYGTPRAGSSSIQPISPAWSVNNWGEDLLVMTSPDGRLLIWKPSTPATKLVAVTGAPVANRQFVVTPQRHVMLFGMGGAPADFGWCSQENINDWNFASTLNTAGEYTLEPFSPILSAHSSSLGILMSTPAMTYIVEWIGLPYVYRYRPIGKVPVPISAASVSSTPQGIMWISVEGFWLYNGTTADIVPCPLWDVVSEKMDFGRTVIESHSVSLLNKGEVWWFWVDPEYGTNCSRYVAIDYRSKVWMGGFLNRTCGLTYSNDRFPIMSDGANVWKHESGLQYPGALFMPFLESQTINIQAGERFSTVIDIIPEIVGDTSALAFSLNVKNNRSDNALPGKYTAQRTANGHGKVDIRESGRDIRLRIDMIKNTDWGTVGPIMFNIKPRGKKA